MITFLTGAGASKPFGYPTTYEFFSSGTGHIIAQSDYYTSLLKYFRLKTIDAELLLEKYHPITQMMNSDIGDWMRERIGKKRNVATDVEQIVNQVKGLCFEYYAKPVSIDRIKALYWDFLLASGLKEIQLRFFTLNYDRTTDELLDLVQDQGFEGSDGFGTRGKWNQNLYPIDTVPGLSVYRLHGSICYVKEGKEVKNTRHYGDRTERPTEDIFIYPGPKPDMARGLHKVLAYPFDQFKKYLRMSELLVVIGYSFRDEHINSMLRTALKENSILRIVSLNPGISKSNIRDNFKLDRELYKKIEAIVGNFGEYDLANYIRENNQQAMNIL